MLENLDKTGFFNNDIDLDNGGSDNATFFSKLFTEDVNNVNLHNDYEDDDLHQVSLNKKDWF